MSRILRVISTAVIGVGLVLLFLYLCLFENTGKELALTQPSYYTIQNYLYIFLAGVGCIAFSVVSSFFSWNKALDKKEEVLPNAIAAEKEMVESWLTGSSLDTKQGTNFKKTSTVHKVQEREGQTEFDAVKKKVEESHNSDKTIVQDQDDQTILDQENTILENKEDTVLEASDGQTVLEYDEAKRDTDSIVSSAKKSSTTKSKNLVFGIAAVLIIIIGICVFVLGNRENNDIQVEAVVPTETKAETADTVKATEETVEETVDSEYAITVKSTGEMLELSAEYLSIQVVNKRNVTVTIENLKLKESYVTNMSTTEENYTEYMWKLDMYGFGTYSVETTAWAFNPGAEEEKTIEEMEHAVWTLVEENGEEYYTRVCEAEMTHDEDSITWEFVIPDEYSIDFAEMQKFAVTVFEKPDDFWMERNYYIES